MVDERFEARSPVEGPAPEKGGRVLLTLVLCGVASLFCLCLTIFTAIALPGYFEPIKPGNEASAIRGLRAIGSAQTIYREADRDNNGEPDFARLEALGSAGLIDAALAGGSMGGYRYTCEVGADSEKTWWALAEPIVPGKTGDRYYFINQSGVVYVSNAAMTIDEATGEPPPGAAPLRR